MPIFRVKSVKIYIGQKKFTREFSWLLWQIWGMDTAGQSASLRPIPWTWSNLEISMFVFSRLERERRWAPLWARTPLATLTTSCQLNLRHRLQNEVWNKWWNKNKKSFHKDLKNTYVCFLQLGKRMPTRWYDTAETNRKEVVTVVSWPDFRVWWFCFLLLYRCK